MPVKRWKKRFLTVVAVLAALLVAAVVVVSQVEFASPRLTGMVIDRISGATGMETRMEDISVRLLQGVRVQGLGIGTEGEEILSVRRITLKFNVLDALFKRFNIRNLVVEEPEADLSLEELAGLALLIPAMGRGPGSDAESGVEFQLAQAELRNGSVKVSTDGKGGLPAELKIDEIDLEISSGGAGKPVEFRAKGRALGMLEFSSSGSYDGSAKEPVVATGKVTIPAGRISAVLAVLAKEPPEFTVSSELELEIDVRGSLDELFLRAKTDLTGSEVAIGDGFRKAAGVPLALDAAATVRKDDVQFDAFMLTLGEAEISGKGSWEGSKKALVLTAATEKLAISKLAPFVPVLEGKDVSGLASFSLKAEKSGSDPIRLDGRVEVKDWQYATMSGERISTDVKTKGTRVYGDALEIVMGEDRLPGSWYVEPGGVWKVRVKGPVSIDRLLERGSNALRGTGSGEVDAEIGGEQGGLAGLRGRGKVRLKDGEIRSFPYLVALAAMINVPELMPFKYDTVAVDFDMEGGVIMLPVVQAEGKTASLRASNVKLDLVQRKKDLKAEIILSPELVRRAQSRFHAFDRVFEVDAEGSAHGYIVWPEPLEESKPDLLRSVWATVETAVEKEKKKIGDKILEEIFKKLEDR